MDLLDDITHRYYKHKNVQSLNDTDLMWLISDIRKFQDETGKDCTTQLLELQDDLMEVEANKVEACFINPLTGEKECG